MLKLLKNKITLQSLLFPFLFIILFVFSIPVFQSMYKYKDLNKVLLENRIEYRKTIRDGQVYHKLSEIDIFQEISKFSEELNNEITELDKYIRLGNSNEIENSFDKILLILESLRNNLISTFLSVIIFYFLITLLLVIVYNFQIRRVKIYQKRIEFENELHKRTFEINHNERTKLARDLHDGIAQELALGRMYVDNLPKNEFKETLSEVFSHTFIKIKELCHELRLTDESSFKTSLSRLIDSFSNRNNIEVVVVDNIEGELLLTPEVSIQLQKIINELLINIKRHTESNKSLLQMDLSDKYLNIKVIDWGKGISGVKEGLGMKGIKERINYINSKIKWENDIDGGTKVTIDIPYEKEGVLI